MAFLRRNYKSLELVVSHRVNGLPRIRILARFKTLDELRATLKSSKQLQILRKKAGDPDLNAQELIKRGTQILKIQSDPVSRIRVSGSINTTEVILSPPFKPKKNQGGKFQFNPSDYIKYREEFEKEVQIEILLKKMIEDLKKSRKTEILSEKVILLFQQFLKDQERKSTLEEIENLKLTVFGPSNFEHDQHGYPFWSFAHGRERTVLRNLPESVIPHRLGLMWGTGFSQYPGHLKYKNGRVEQFDTFIKSFVSWIATKKGIA